METTSQKRMFGQLLAQEGLISETQLKKALTEQYSAANYLPLGEMCVRLKFISRNQLMTALKKFKKRIYMGDLLVNMGLLSQEDLFQALELQQIDGKRLGRILIEHGIITENNLINTLSMQLGIPKMIPSVGIIAPSILEGISKAFLQKADCIPVYREGNRVRVIMSDPLADETLMALEKIYHCQIDPAVAPSEDIQKCIKVVYEDLQLPSRKDKGKTRDRAEKKLVIGDRVSVEQSTDNIAETANYLLSHAVEESATDIHIEPMENLLRIRYRIDGIMRHKTDLPLFIADDLMRCLKATSGLDISGRKHQDGRIGARIMNRDYDLRLSTYPTITGESLVIRVLSSQSTMMELEMLGFSPTNLELYKKLLAVPSGVTMIAGPSGSGKTTTLYASLLFLKEMDKKILTVEDPVEYTIDSVVQGQISEARGLTYANFVKSMLRQDPDVIMIGEIRDRESAHAVVETALTGHKVLTSFHTDETTGALIRMHEVGVEAFLISSTVMSVVVQRLVRRLCAHCREPYTPGEDVLSSYRCIHPITLDNHTFYSSQGCMECDNTGYQGRTAINEILLVNNDIRDAILTKQPTGKIRAIARQTAGLISMMEDGFYKATMGITSLEEVLRIVTCHESDAAFPLSSEQVVSVCEMGSRAYRSTTPSGKRVFASGTIPT